MEGNGMSLRPGVEIDRQTLLGMAEDGVYVPQGLGLEDSLHNMALIMDMVNEAAATETSITPTSQPFEAAEPISGTPQASGCKDNEAGELPSHIDSFYRYVLSLSYANSPGLPATDDCVVFKPFKRFPLKIRSKIWKTAAHAAKASSPGVFNFTYKKMPLVAGTEYSQLTSELFDHIHLLRPGGQLARDIRELMRNAFDGDSILTLTPSLVLAELTRGVRDVFRSCPEARAELMRYPELSSAFNFHWIKSSGKINLGTIRPFCYDTDWISLDGLDYILGSELGFGRPGDPGVRCTPDLGRIQHLAFPYYSAPQDDYTMEPDMQLDVLYWLGSLKSVGFYRPSFTITRAMVPHCDAVLTSSQRLFLKGVPGPSPVSDRALLSELNDQVFQVAMLRLERLVRVIRGIGRAERWHELGKRFDFTALKFCFLIHADSREALDLMKFREDGSHLDHVSCNWLDDPECFGRMIKGVDPSGQ